MRTFETAGAPHVRGPNTVRRVMLDVLLALVPAVALNAWFFGIGVLVQLALAVAFALAVESAMLAIRGREQAKFLGDCSALVTAALFAISIPPLAPWWIALVGMIAAIAVAKHLYGGIGFNLFNPAMVGYVVVLVSFPLDVSRWAAATPADTLAAIFGAGPASWDAIAQATPLDLARRATVAGQTLPEIGDALAVAASPFRWLALAYLLGGAYLCVRRTADWRIPAAMLGTMCLLATPAWLLASDLHLSPIAHLLVGASVAGAFFIATDPVSGATTPRGRWIYGAGIGALTLAIREFGAFPDGVAFAVLLMNCAAPLIDRWTIRRPYGHPP